MGLCQLELGCLEAEVSFLRLCNLVGIGGGLNRSILFPTLPIGNVIYRRWHGQTEAHKEKHVANTIFSTTNSIRTELGSDPAGATVRNTDCMQIVRQSARCWSVRSQQL